MSNLPALTDDQMELIKNTVAKGATDNELKLFLYRCKEIGLDPLKPGQIFFIKYGSGPGTIVIGRDGFRARAAAIGLHTGTKVGIIRDEKGHCLGAWCEVYRKDWKEPAREEVSLKEYDTGKGLWARMPETLIKKVAEVAALRMAFPDQLSGLYSQDEMDQATPAKLEEPKTVRIPVKKMSDVEEEAAQEAKNEMTALRKDIEERKPLPSLKDAFLPETAEWNEGPGEYVAKVGRDGGPILGFKIKDIDPNDLLGFMQWLRRGGKDGASKEFLSKPLVQEFIVNAEDFINEQKEQK